MSYVLLCIHDVCHNFKNMETGLDERVVSGPVVSEWNQVLFNPQYMEPLC